MEGTLEAIKANCIEEGNCWLWQGAMSHGTTPIMRINGSRKLVPVRRFILQLKGAKVEGKKSYITCGNPKCVNPAHIKPMTGSQMLKRVAKQTGYAQRISRNAKIAAGKRKHSPITPELVAEIRSSPESGHAIARRLGFCQATVQAIRAHDTWKDYDSPYLQLAA
jgi:hypothetical protein